MSLPLLQPGPILMEWRSFANFWREMNVMKKVRHSYSYGGRKDGIWNFSRAVRYDFAILL